MFKSFEEAKNHLRTHEYGMVDLKFSDLWGRWHHVTIPAGQFTEQLMRDGVGFDGSSVGLKSVKSGDMVLLPDLATAFRDQVADTFTEVLPELRADAEVTEQELRERDLVLFGGIESNALLARMAREHALPVAFGDGFFRFQGRLYAAPDDGVAFAMPNPWNPRRTVYVFSANTRTQLWRMTRSYPRGLAGWALWKGAEVASKGFHESPSLTVTFE